MKTAKVLSRKTIAKSLLMLMISLLLLLSGCWDYQEVESRGYVLGLAIDKAEPVPRGQEELDHYLTERKIEKMPQHEGEPKYAYTIQIPIIPQALIKPGEGGSGGGARDRTWDLTIVGKSFFEANRQFSTRLDYPPFYEHLKVIIINEDVARGGILEPLDVLLRDHEMRRRTKVFVTPQDAKSTLDVTPRIDDYAALYLDKLPLNASKTSRMAHVTDLGEVSKSIHGQLDFVLPRIIVTEDEIKNAGLAVFKKNKMVGYLGELDTVYAKIIRDAVLGGIILVESPYNPERIVTLEITDSKTKVRPVVDKDSITMDIQVEMTFNLVEEMRLVPANTFDRGFLREVEKKANEKLQVEVKDTVRYVQEEFGADIFHFNVAMQRYEPKKWQEIEEDWYQIFPHVKTSVNAKTVVKLTGLIK